MIFKSIASAKHLHNKTVLVRIDTNVPLEGKRIVDDVRLRESVPTIRLLERKGAKVILIGHLGQPTGKRAADLSLKPIGYALGKILRQPVKVLPLTMAPEAIQQQAEKGLVLLENIRFNKGEDKNSLELARWLASLGQVYVNEAFSYSHRAAASVVALSHKLPSYAGLRLIYEVESLERVRKNGAKPLVAVIGGAKIGDKLPVIEKLLPRLQSVLVGGGVANTFLKAQGYRIGQSLINQAEVGVAKKMIKRAGRKLIMPVDVVIDQVGTKRPEAWLKKVGELKSGDKIVDIGTQSCIVYAKHLKKAKTIFWSGPLGLVEQPNWQHATLALGRLVGALARRRAYVVVGGGDTAGFFHQHGLNADFFSTGGGAMLKFLAGEELPGLTALSYSRTGK